MKIQDYLDELRRRLEAQFRDPGRQMTLADLGVVYATCCALAAEHVGSMKAAPYEPESES